jgi:uncharacterized damage-inducible protein DinB
MKTSISVLKIGILSCVLLTVFENSSSGRVNIRKDKPHKKPSYIFTENQAPFPLLGAIERQLNYIEKQIIDLAEAMPADKFDFTPENLNLAGSEFKAVRTFAGQVKHLATDNFAIWSPLTGEPLRSDITDVNGPGNIKTKADIIKFLKESFALGHKAIATLTEKNAMEMLDFRGSKLARLDLAFYALTHSNEHYGQMVVYIRMCGIIPPASRPA